eukprot:jgi/Bigna1/129782/aug1.9_g4490
MRRIWTTFILQVLSLKQELLSSILDLKEGAEQTSEKKAEETLTFRKNGLFGKTFKNAFQDIDVVSGRLQNLIVFDDGYFSVSSTLERDMINSNRCNFVFTSAEVKYANFGPFRLPPFGRGWFETVYMDSDLRVARDIRGDTLIVMKDSSSEPFTIPVASGTSME